MNTGTFGHDSISTSSGKIGKGVNFEISNSSTGDHDWSSVPAGKVFRLVTNEGIDLGTPTLTGPLAKVAAIDLELPDVGGSRIVLKKQ